MSKSNRKLILNRISHRTKILQDNADYIADTCSSIAEILAISIKSGNKLMFCGNGGSAAESQHMAAEYCATLDHHKPREGMPAIALTTDTSLITAWANDFGFETYFERQVKAHGKKNDILFLISTGGGNLLNGASTCLIKAADEAKKREMFLISLVGKSGGELKKTSDICIHVANDTTAFIQEAHMSILHCICEILETELAK